MKKTNLIYWISTALFAAFMVSTSVPDVLMVKEATAFITQLGYPAYFVPFIGWAKILGCIALLVPGFPRIKEWAYAGLFFDLFGAVYSAIASAGVDPRMSFMLLPFGLFTVSYIYFHKRMRLQAAAKQSLR